MISMKGPFDTSPHGVETHRLRIAVLDTYFETGSPILNISFFDFWILGQFFFT